MSESDRLDRRVVILDDDPTGTQTSSDVDVLLVPTEQSAAAFGAARDRACFVLTNSRALPRDQASELVRDVTTHMHRALAARGQAYTFILRGDSTLRGHVFAEVDVLATAHSVTLFVPAFPEGGRVTLDGVQYIRRGEGLVPVVLTEFAADPTFGYSSMRLVDWVAEVGGNRPAQSIRLDDLRTRGPEAVTRALLEAPSGTVVIPDGESRADLEMVRDGLVKAESERPVVVRSAATFASVYGGLEPRVIDAVSPASGAGILVVCGSYTTGASQQISRLVERYSPPVVELPPASVFAKDPRQVGQRAGAELVEHLRNGQLVLLMTPRNVEDRQITLQGGAEMMQTLTVAVMAVADRVGAVIAKGGITAAEVARKGFGAQRARVMGQVQAGVSLWELAARTGTIPYVVVPGNVGDEDTLVEILARIEPGAVRARPLAGA